MTFQNLSPDKNISLFVKNIWVFESVDKNLKTNLPFFADGYPGLMFQQTDNGLTVNPHKKMMPVLFLYGQTIRPIELEINGAYQLIAFQLYPFVLKSLFNITPHTINDDCYDLRQLPGVSIATFIRHLLSERDVDKRVERISFLLHQLFQSKRENLDLKIKQVIETIISTKGQENIGTIVSKLKINSRTLERRFFNETGLSPKQFAKIIQFQSSLQQITVKDYTTLTDVVYENGFTDQSHFIKVFKGFTGKTPKTFSRK
jgi:AraC-like DNA-binding protein